MKRDVTACLSKNKMYTCKQILFMMAFRNELTFQLLLLELAQRKIFLQEPVVEVREKDRMELEAVS